MNNQEKKPFFTVKRMTQLAILIALIMILGLTPLGFIRIGVIEITILVIPVSLGAILLGPISGLILGFTFGLASFLQCVTGTTPFSATLFAINPFFTFLVCIPTRTLMGYLVGLIYKLISSRVKSEKGKIAAHLTSNVAGALLNTILFMTALCLCFYHTDYIQSLVESSNSKNVLAFVVAFVGVNGLIEAGASIVIGAIISYPLEKALISARLI